MNKHPKYDFITAKVQKGFRPESEGLWLQMKTILDQEMPQKKGNKRFIFWYSVIMGVLVTAGFSIYLYKASNKAHTDNFINVKFADNKTKKAGFDEMNDLDQNKDLSNPEVNSSATENKKFNFGENNKPVFNAGSVEPKPQVQQGSSEQTVTVSERDRDIIALIIQNRSRKQHAVKSGRPFKNGKPNTQLIVSTLSVPANNFVLTGPAKSIQGATDIPVTTVDKPVASQPVRATDPIHYLAKRNTLGNADNKAVVLQDGSLKKAIITPTMDRSVVKTIKPSRVQWNKFVAGISVNASLPLSSQEMSKISPRGTESRLFDFLPSVHLQYHLNRKLYVATELQFVSPQYTPQLTLFSKRENINASKFNENSISLNKLYYLNIPVSIHYSPLKNVFIGGGIQYASLTRSVMTEQEATWQKNGSEWKQTASKKTTKVKSNPSQERKNYHANNGQGQGQPPQGIPEMPTDSIAGSFRSNDWRFLVDASYQYRKFSAGFRFNMGLNNYVNLEVTNGTGTMAVKDRNKSFMLYLRYNIFDKRK